MQMDAMTCCMQVDKNDTLRVRPSVTVKMAQRLRSVTICLKNEARKGAPLPFSFFACDTGNFCTDSRGAPQQSKRTATLEEDRNTRRGPQHNRVTATRDMSNVGSSRVDCDFTGELYNELDAQRCNDNRALNVPRDKKGPLGSSWSQKMKREPETVKREPETVKREPRRPWSPPPTKRGRSLTLEGPKRRRSPTLKRPKRGRSPTLEGPKRGRSPTLQGPKRGQSPTLERPKRGRSPTLEGRGVTYRQHWKGRSVTCRQPWKDHRTEATLHRLGGGLEPWKDHRTVAILHRLGDILNIGPNERSLSSSRILTV